MGCKALFDSQHLCMVWRAQYERKKAAVQTERYEQARDGALQKETREITEDQIIKILAPIMTEKLLNKRGRVDVNKLRLYLKDNHSMLISPYKAYNLKGILEAEHPEKLNL